MNSSQGLYDCLKGQVALDRAEVVRGAGIDSQLSSPNAWSTQVVHSSFENVVCSRRVLAVLQHS